MFQKIRNEKPKRSWKECFSRAFEVLRLHGWWFELRHADVYAYEDSLSRFVLIDDAQAKRLLKRLESHGTPGSATAI